MMAFPYHLAVVSCAISIVATVSPCIAQTDFCDELIDKAAVKKAAVMIDGVLRQDETFIVYFAPSEYEVDAADVKTISNASRLALDLQSPLAIVSGHADLSGTEEENLQLSLERSAAVARELMPRLENINTELLVLGLSECRPAVRSPARLNRRVEITLFR